MILFWMDLFYRQQMDAFSPVRIAPKLNLPVMLIHGEKDRRFPLEFALRLKNSFLTGSVELYIAPGVGHSDSSLTAGYKTAIKSFLEKNF
jgi:dipeptidyl aminopeptidase/acylaminoacyl peptidase